MFDHGRSRNTSQLHQLKVGHISKGHVRRERDREKEREREREGERGKECGR